jgi:protein phosphatase
VPNVNEDTFGISQPGSALFRGAPEHMIVLCSDGVWGMIGEPAVRDILLGSRDPEQTCRALIEAADQAGGHDNETVVSVLVRSRR